MRDSEEFKENTVETLVEAGDSVIQFLSENEIFGQIPVFGLLYKTSNALLAMPNYLFLKKAERFAQKFNDKTTLDERIKFADTIKTDKKKREVVYEYIPLKLDKYDDMSKPEIFASIFACYAIDKIGYEEFDSLTHALSSSSLSDLNGFSKNYWISQYNTSVSSLTEDRQRNLITSGLVSFDLNKRAESGTSFAPPPLPSLASPLSSSDNKPIPYNIGFSITDLGHLYAYVSEEFEDYFYLEETKHFSGSNRLYEFINIKSDQSLKRKVERKWKLS